MKLPDPFLDNYPFSGWQSLGELKLPKDSDIETAIQAWLLETLEPLHLNTDFLNRFSLSVKDTARNLMESSLAAQESGHIHLRLFTRRKGTTGTYSWGFFRIEKLEDVTEMEGIPNHAIEFYLYPEG